MSKKEISLFDTEYDSDDWQEEWKDMPEFVQEKQDEAYAKIIFRFENEEDLQAFAKLIGQKLTNKTKSSWHPYKSHWGGMNKLWVDENDEDDE
jgi:hypothetical protein